MKEIKELQSCHLSGLDGVTEKTVVGYIITCATDVQKHLKDKRYLTAAGDNGAINIYLNDFDRVICQRMVFMRTEEDVKFQFMKDAVKWAKSAFEKIR